jgi:hypothetical protein
MSSVCNPVGPERAGRLAPIPGIHESASCETYRAVDLVAVKAAEADLPAALTTAAERRAEASFGITPPSGFEAGRILLTEKDTGWGAKRFVAVFRSPTGAWRARSLFERVSPRPAAIVEAEVSQDLASRIERILAEPCFYSEPAVMPRAVPLKDGRLTQVYDGNATLLEVEVGGRKRTSYQVGHPWGFTAELRNVLVRIGDPHP